MRRSIGWIMIIAGLIVLHRGFGLSWLGCAIATALVGIVGLVYGDAR